MSVVQSSGGAQRVGVFGGRVGEVVGVRGEEAGCCSHAHVPQRSCVGIII